MKLADILEIILAHKDDKKIYLIDKNITTIPPGINQWRNVEELFLTSNLLTTLPPEIGQLTHLVVLDLTENKFKTIPVGIFQLINLQQLYLRGNELTSLPAEISQLINLNKINLAGNKLTNVSPEIKLLQNLHELYLSNNQLSFLPSEIGQLINLKELYLGYNQLTELPEEIGRLLNLIKLYIRNNNLKELPTSLGLMKNLKELVLRNNRLTAIPAEIGHLVFLSKLDLNNNQLMGLPAEIGNLSNLTELFLDNNRLNAIPDEFYRLINLKELDLGNNQLDNISTEIRQLTNLTMLDLSHNDLNAFPADIGQLFNLSELNLRHNRLTGLPSEIGKLTKLRRLYLSDNNIAALPMEIGHLLNLTHLDLSSNQLTTVPESVVRLPKLRMLKLEDNPLETPPPEVAAQGLEAIREFFRQLKDAGVDYLYEAKLLIVGEAGAGKTTLARKIENPDYELGDEVTTRGIDVTPWRFSTEHGHAFQVNIWDFGGQKIYQEPHQFFLTKRSLYALVADDRKEDTDFYWWLQVVDLLSDNSPILIIKNEKQDRQRSINERQLRGQFSNLKGILATNLATKRGLDSVVSAIKHHIQELPHVGSQLPKTWVKVRETLERDCRNYMGLEEYLNLCQEHGFTQRQDKLQLSEYLHDLGVCLHFQKDPLLKNILILNRTWGIDAVYRVLDNQQIKDNLGRFTKADLETIWSEPHYAERQDELLQLMINFKLCYQIPGSEGTYIVPHLLSESQPEYEWDASGNLVLRYTYEFMPKGILTKFIVEMHRYIAENNLMWRGGVVLEKDQTRAEVLEHYGKREIIIRVTGRHPSDLLHNVIYELDKIHEEIKRLKWSKLVPCNCEKCRNSQESYFFDFEVLRNAAREVPQIQCQKSFKMVDVLGLIDVIMDRDKFLAPKKVKLEPITMEQKKEGSKMIKILFLTANPADSFRLRLDEESRAIDQALRQAQFRDQFDIQQHWAVKIGDLQGLLLRHKPDIIHFSGHGNQDGIILEDNQGRSKTVSIQALRTLFSVLKDNIRCVVLNSCYSEAQANAIAEHIDCVIGMTSAIGDKSAISFATSFYQALGYGRDVKTAFDLGSIQIDMEGLNDYDIPRLIAKKLDPSTVTFA